MTQEIIEMANKAGCVSYTKPPMRAVVGASMTFAQLEAFAKLVAAKEREACADMVFRYISQTDNMEARGCLASVAYDIRARGQA